jgi:hypothetical protein
MHKFNADILSRKMWQLHKVHLPRIKLRYRKFLKSRLELMNLINPSSAMQRCTTAQISSPNLQTAQVDETEARLPRLVGLKLQGTAVSIWVGNFGRGAENIRKMAFLCIDNAAYQAYRHPG